MADAVTSVFGGHMHQMEPNLKLVGPALFPKSRGHHANDAQDCITKIGHRGNRARSES